MIENFEKFTVSTTSPHQQRYARQCEAPTFITGRERYRDLFCFKTEVGEEKGREALTRIIDIVNILVLSSERIIDENIDQIAKISVVSSGLMNFFAKPTTSYFKLWEELDKSVLIRQDLTERLVSPSSILWAFLTPTYLEPTEVKRVETLENRVIGLPVVLNKESEVLSAQEDGTVGSQEIIIGDIDRFEPSRDLSGLVKRGHESINELCREAITTVDFAESGTDLFFDRLSDEEISETITLRLERMLATLAYRLIQEGKQSVEIASNGRFSPLLQYEILERILVQPDEYTIFFNLLLNEISDFLDFGGRFAGDWGRLVIKGESLNMELVKGPAQINENWELPSSIERGKLQ